MNSILNIKVSCFKDYDTSWNPKDVNLLAWLQSDKYTKTVERIRLIEDKKTRDELKATLPGITASGNFSYRAKKDLIKHSGLIAIDIDLKGNEQTINFKELKKHLCNIPNVAYCGLSVSGKGYWCLVPISQPENHELHFKALQEAFKKFNIKIDEACKDVCRLRGYSYDPEAYFNHNAKVFTATYREPPKKILPPRKVFKTGHSKDKISIAVNMINNAADDAKHSTLLKAAKLMGGYIASGEVDEHTAIDAMETAIKGRDIDSMEAAKKTIKSGVVYGKNSPISFIQAQGVDRRVCKKEIKEPYVNKKSLTQGVEKVFEPQSLHPAEAWKQVKDKPIIHWEIAELETFFKTITLPTDPVKINQSSTITDIYLFVSAHLDTVKANNGNQTFLPYLQRLEALKEITSVNI